MAATHTGTCQVCGRRQAVTGSWIAKHGYQVKGFGFFMGVCPGAQHQPLELHRDTADRIAADLLVAARNHERAAVDVETGVSIPLFAYTGNRVKVTDSNGRSRMTNEKVPFVDATPLQQADTIRRNAMSCRNEARMCEETSVAMTKRADEIHGKQELQPRGIEQRREIVPGLACVCTTRKPLCCASRIVRCAGSAPTSTGA
jgi:hypothetical protein